MRLNASFLFASSRASSPRIPPSPTTTSSSSCRGGSVTPLPSIQPLWTQSNHRSVNAPSSLAWRQGFLIPLSPSTHSHPLGKTTNFAPKFNTTPTPTPIPKTKSPAMNKMSSSRTTTQMTTAYQRSSRSPQLLPRKLRVRAFTLCPANHYAYDSTSPSTILILV